MADGLGGHGCCSSAVRQQRKLALVNHSCPAGPAPCTAGQPAGAAPAAARHGGGDEGPGQPG
ncbi:hypothetical protein HaLaN_07150, partial [Haematococcus lacustris]